MKHDSLLRDDMQKKTAFALLSLETQKLLRRAVGRARCSVKLSDSAAAELTESGRGEGWIMVPSKRGERQVVIAGARCWAL